MRLLLVLVVMTAAAQSPAGFDGTAIDEASVHAPAQVVVDHVPVVATWTIDEADFDGTPGRAHVLLDQMRAFHAGVTLAAYPSRAVAAGTDDAAHAWTGQVLAVLSDLPEAGGLLARVHAACDAWTGNATREAYVQWRTDADGSQASLASVRAGLTALADAAPAAIDARPLRTAAAILEDWREARWSATDACLVDLADRVAQGAQPDLPARFWLVPSRAWPTQQVLALGWATEGTVRITSDLGWDTVAARDGLAFTAHLQVPADASLGAHDVHASAPADRVASLEVIRAPTALVLEGARHGEPGATVVWHVRLTSPALALLRDGEGVTGSLGERAFVDAAARFELTVPAQTTSYTFVYPGSDRLEPSQVVVTLGPYAAGTPAPGAGPSGGAPGGGTSGPGVPGSGILDGPFPAWIALLVLLLLLIASVALRRRRRAVPTAVAATPPRLPSQLVAAFAAFVLWLRRLGWAKAGSTPRDVGRTLSQRGIAVGSFVTRFERVRYGGEADATEGRAAAWLRRVQRALWVRR